MWFCSLSQQPLHDLSSHLTPLSASGPGLDLQNPQVSKGLHYTRTQVRLTTSAKKAV